MKSRSSAKNERVFPARHQASVVRALVVVALVVAAVVALAQPREDFDLMAYVGVVHRYDARTDGEARERTLADLGRHLTPERYAWMVGRDYPDSYARAMASEDRSFGQQLGWFRGRPLHTRAAWALTKAGLSTPRALHVVAWLSSLALSGVLFLATAGVSRPWLRLASFALVAGAFHLADLAASPLADPLSALLVVGGTLLVLEGGGAGSRLGLGALVVAVFARTDNAMYAASLAAFACIMHVFPPSDPTRRVPPLAASASAACALGLRAWLERDSYGWWALVHFRRVKFEPYPRDVRPPFSLSTYLGVLRAWALEVYACEVLALIGLAWLLVDARARGELRRQPLVAYGALMVPLSVARFFAFPDWDSRFFIAPLGLFFLGLAYALDARLTQRAAHAIR
ncbi:MAG: hypothetical protein IPQ09_18250 [Myxococcales bacterium]|nr:hypothetical protein [Myxococcales bacterium]